MVEKLGVRLIVIAALLAPAVVPTPADAAGWTLVGSDDFSGSVLDTDKWGSYDATDMNGVSRLTPDAISVAGGELRITGTGTNPSGAGNTSSGMAWEGGDQRYGKWQVRAKFDAGTGYAPVLLLWPRDDADWAAAGEVDFSEIIAGDRSVNNFTLHYGANNVQNGTSVSGDFTQWHVYTVEWTPTLSMFVDETRVFHTSAVSTLPPGPMHLAIQQNCGPYADWIPAPDDTTPASTVARVDYVRIYSYRT